MHFFNEKFHITYVAHIVFLLDITDLNNSLEEFCY